MLECLGMNDSFVGDKPRYERKFLLNPYQGMAVKHLVKMNPAGFTQAYIPRTINNIYYDTSDLSHFRENIAGVSPRKKVRVRWYGAFGSIIKPTLEIKSKDGEVVTKYSKILNISNLERIPELLVKTGNKYLPVLKNSYFRQYYISADRKIRLTIDTKVTFDDVSTKLSTSPQRPLPPTIIELKYALPDEKRAVEVASYFPYRLTKSSKYEQGVSLCYPHLTIL